MFAVFIIGLGSVISARRQVCLPILESVVPDHCTDSCCDPMPVAKHRHRTHSSIPDAALIPVKDPRQVDLSWIESLFQPQLQSPAFPYMVCQDFCRCTPVPNPRQTDPLSTSGGFYHLRV